MSNMLKYVSLFTGIGGFDLGFDRAGMTCMAQVEKDKHCLAVLRKHWPNTTRFTDVTTIEHRLAAKADVVCGGFPCQDLSVAGRRAGLDGERSGLWYAFRDVLDGSRPNWVVIENVPGLLSSNQGRDFAVVVRGLVELGYSVAWRVFDSQHFGVPQSRRRLFIVGHIGDGRASQILRFSEWSGGHSETCKQARQETAETFGLCTERNSKGELSLSKDAPRRASCALLASDSARGVCDMHTEKLIAAPVDLAQVTSWANKSACKWGAPAYTLAARGMPAVLIGKGHFDQPTVLPAVTSKWAKSSERASGDECQNLVGCSDVRFGVRRLTPRECERLQAFPDDWTAKGVYNDCACEKPISDLWRYRMLGNAVTVNVAEAIGRIIVESNSVR